MFGYTPSSKEGKKHLGDRKSKRKYVKAKKTTTGGFKKPKQSKFKSKAYWKGTEDLFG